MDNMMNLSPIQSAIVIQSTDLVTTEVPSGVSGKQTAANLLPSLSIDTLMQIGTSATDPDQQHHQLAINSIEQNMAANTQTAPPLTVASLELMRKEASQKVKKGLINSLGFLPFYNVKSAPKNTVVAIESPPPPSYLSSSGYKLSDEHVDFVDPASFVKSSHRPTIPRKPSPLRWG